MKIVFCDIDGTFQEMGEAVPQINFDAVHALQKQGDHFVFITGRGYEQLSELMERLEAECDVIFSNGGGFKRIGQPVSYNHCLSIENCEKILAILESRKLFYHLHTNQGILLKPIANYQANILALREKLLPMGETGKQIMDFKETFFSEECQQVADPIAYLKAHPEVKVMKIELMEADDAIHLELRQLLKSETTYIFSSFIQCLEIADPLSSKGEAVKEFMQSFPEATSYGIGDGENDLAMLEVVDVPIAVDNAKQIVKEQCKKIIGTCETGSVGQFIFEELID